MAGVRLRDDFDGGMVRAVAKTAEDGQQVRRFLALAAIHEGAQRGGAEWRVSLQIVRDPVLRFNAFGPVGRINRKAGRDAGSGRCRSLRTGPAWRWPPVPQGPLPAGTPSRITSIGMRDWAHGL